MPGWDDLSPAPPKGAEPGYAAAFQRGVRDAHPTTDAWEKLNPTPPAAPPETVDRPSGMTLADLVRGTRPPASTRDEIVRGLGMGAGSLVDGAGGALGFFVNPLNTVANVAADAVGAGKPFSTHVGEGWSETLGLPQPQNRTERLLHDVQYGAAGGLATAGATLPLAGARVAPGVARSLMQFLADAPVVNTVAGATGSGASGVAREAGGNEWAQLAAGLAGGLVGGIGAARFARSGAGAPRAPGDPMTEGSLDPSAPPQPLLPAPAVRRGEMMDGEWTDVPPPLALPAPPAGLPDLRAAPGIPANSNRPAPAGTPNGAVTPDVIAPPVPAPPPGALETIQAMMAARDPSGRAALMGSTAAPPPTIEDVWSRIAARRNEPPANDRADLALPPPAPITSTAGIGSRARMNAITMATESRGQRYGKDGGLLTSPKGAKGEMQVLDGTNTDPGYGVTPARNNSPEERARVGRDYLDALTRHYGDDPAKGWAAYNAGPGRLDRALRYGDAWLEHMPAETKAYVAKNMKALGGDDARIVLPETGGKLSGNNGLTPESFSAVDRERPIEDLPPVKVAEPEPLPPLSPPAPVRATGDLPPIHRAEFRPNDIAADGALMQFKAGGDAAGVTDRLRGVSRWEPALDNPVTVWEANDGRRLVADGHQRLGLAKRLEADGHPPITLSGKVLREADGWTAPEARAVAAIKNMAEGSGTSLDAAKVIRDLGEDGFARWHDRLPQRGVVVREGRDLARLSPEAFGAVVNDVIPADQAAAIGRLLPDQPDAHMPMVTLLHEVDPPNARQAESVIRQAISDGFHEGEQTDMFGTQASSASLYGVKAKIIHEASKALGGRARLFGTAAKEGDTLAAVGNHIEQDASARESTANATAAQLVERLATRRGNPVSDALDAAARKVAAGGKRADATREFVEHVRGLDHEAVARGGGSGVPGGNRADEGQPALIDAPRDERGALERASEGRQRADVGQKPPGSDGGLFDAPEAHQDGPSLFHDPGKPPRSGPPGGLYSNPFFDPEVWKWFFRPMKGVLDPEFLNHDAAALIQSLRRTFGSPRKSVAATWDRMRAFGEAFPYSADSAMRSMEARYEAPTIGKLADQFYAEVGTRKVWSGKETAAAGRTYPEAVRFNTARFGNDLHAALKPFEDDAAALGRIRDLLATPTASVRATAGERSAAGTIRDLLKEVLEYRRDAGEDIGEVKDGYFPRQLRFDKAAADPAAFRLAATRTYRALGVEDPGAAADAWLARVVDGHLGISDGIIPFPKAPGANTAKAREFGEYADRYMRAFYETNPLKALNGYVTGSVKRAEQSRRFGPKGRVGSDERAEWVSEHGDRSQWDVMKSAIQDELRAKGENATGIVERLDGIRQTNLGMTRPGTSPRTGAVVSTIHAWNQLGTLAQAVFASLPEIAMGFVRAGPRLGFTHLATTADEFMRNVRRAPKSDARRWADAVGATSADSALALLRARSDDPGQNVVASKLLHQFYRKNGLEAWTDAGRTAAVKTGQRFIDVLVGDMASSDARTRVRAMGYLRELGVSDPAAFAQSMGGGAPKIADVRAAGERGMDAEYATALLRFADQSVIMPTRAMKPSWASHPVGSLFFALQSYSYGFKKNVLDRVARETVEGIKERDPVKLSAAAGLAVLTVSTGIVQGLRHLIYGTPASQEDQTPAHYVLETMDRTGLFAAMSPLINGLEGLRYRRSLGESLQGSVLGRTSDALTKIGKAATSDNPNTNTDERAAAAAFYDVAVKPGIDAVGAGVLGGAAGSAVILGTGVRQDSGVLPSDREAFVGTVAGAKPPKGGE